MNPLKKICMKTLSVLDFRLCNPCAKRDSSLGQVDILECAAATALSPGRNACGRGQSLAESKAAAGNCRLTRLRLPQVPRISVSIDVRLPPHSKMSAVPGRQHDAAVGSLGDLDNAFLLCANWYLI